MVSRNFVEESDNLLVKLDSAIAAARGAGRLLLGKDSSKINIESKGANDIVTEMDRASERFIIEYLGKRYPNDNFWGEELGETTHGDGGRWIIDPIDGTENYVHNIPNYTISIGYEQTDGVLSLGVIYNPCQNEMFYAAMGHGAFLSGKPIHVSEVQTPSLALSIISPPQRMREKAPIYFTMVETIFSKTRDIRHFGSAALNLCYVACGRADAFYEFGLKYYDIAAGLVILSEAGGRYSAFSESENVLETGNIVATNGHLQKWYRNQISHIMRE